ncbi:MAG: aminodeoxychorismate lyase [Nitrosomonadales bacterium]|nr:aminodeoxychorismate lyase [Nitrosomonadales bacterium]|tara:strand:+ start:2220 stop:3224 length:1005 start_codon:yes stop_codon:yes gene_type:complete
MNNKIIKILKIIKNRKILIINCLIIFWLVSYLFLPLNITEDNASFEVIDGSNLNEITEQLVEVKVLKDSFRFKLLTFIFAKTESLKRGHYKLESNATALDLLDMLVYGKESLYSISFPEGLTFKQIIKKIKANKNIKKTLKSYDEEAILKAISSNKKYVEGLFFPDSYYFYKDTSDIEILKNAHNVLKRKLELAWNNRSKNLPYKNMYEALIMASIIEKEVGVLEEAPVIAGVFVNRLNINMPLQSDPTVIYGIRHKFKGNLKKKHLKKYTPFNTYVIKALPPSPISLPSFNSIEAALNPATTSALYFVAKGNRRHHFSATLKEHNKAVRKYQK